MKIKSELAIFEGRPLIPNHEKLKIYWPIINADDFFEIKMAFDERDFSGRGSERVKKLELDFEKRFNGRFATALNSGTAALHLALASLDIKPGDEVIVPAFTFVATAMSVVHNQSVPIFADVGEDYNILPESIEKNITNKTRAVIVVHLHGLPAKIKQNVGICKKYNLKLIEDVAQAPGARYFGKEVGSFGDAAVFSMMSQKNLATCGECGILLNRKLEDKNKAEKFRIYGEIISKNKERVYNSFSLGWNYTLNPIQAAMASSQLKRFDVITRKIQHNARKLNKLISKEFNWIIPPVESKNLTSVFHFYRFRLNPGAFGYRNYGRFRAVIQLALNAEGLNVRHYQNTPVSGQSFFQQEGINRIFPWSLDKNFSKYSIYDYPNTLDAIRSTLVLGGIGSSPAYLLCPGTIEKYIAGFRKIEKNMDRLLRYADEIEYHDPWEEISKTSDSYKSIYR